MNKVMKVVSVAVVVAALFIFIVLHLYKGNTDTDDRAVVKMPGKQVEDAPTPTQTQRYNLDDEGDIILPTDVEDTVILPADTYVEEDYEWRATLFDLVSEIDVVKQNELKPYLSQIQYLDEGVIDVIVGFEGTDLQLLAETSNYDTWEVDDVVNKYGSDYPIVIWVDLPDDSLAWYDAMYSEGLDGIYKGEQISNSQCVLTDLETNEERVLFK